MPPPPPKAKLGPMWGDLGRSIRGGLRERPLPREVGAGLAPELGALSSDRRVNPTALTPNFADAIELTRQFGGAALSLSLSLWDADNGSRTMAGSRFDQGLCPKQGVRSSDSGDGEFLSGSGFGRAGDVAGPDPIGSGPPESASWPTPEPERQCIARIRALSALLRAKFPADRTSSRPWRGFRHRHLVGLPLSFLPGTPNTKTDPTANSLRPQLEGRGSFRNPPMKMWLRSRSSGRPRAKSMGAKSA